MIDLAMTLPESPIPYTIEEYVRREATAGEKHEFHDGDIQAMSGGSPEHSLIIMNTSSAIHTRLRGKPYRNYESNLRIRIPSVRRYVYADGSIFCAPLEYDPEDPSRQSVVNPRVIIEVLSPTTEAYDRGEKFSQYRRLDSLIEYVLISQSEALVETFVRREAGAWLMTPFSGLESVAKLQGVEIDLPLSEIYAGVEFPLLRDRAPYLV
jgi:Uma2 family endonuclease